MVWRFISYESLAQIPVYIYNFVVSFLSWKHPFPAQPHPATHFWAGTTPSSPVETSVADAASSVISAMRQHRYFSQLAEHFDLA